MAGAGRPQDHRRHAALPPCPRPIAPEDRRQRPRRPRLAGCRRAGNRTTQPAGTVRLGVRRSGPATAGGLRPRRSAGTVRRLSADGGHIQGWVTSTDVLPDSRAPDRRNPGRDRASAGRGRLETWGQPINPAQPVCPAAWLSAYRDHHRRRVPAAGRKLAAVSWPPASIPVSVLRRRRLRPPDPQVIVAVGDRVSMLVPASEDPQPRRSGQPACDGEGHHG